MYPAISVILFTTVSGAGYGLAIWLGIGAAMAPGSHNNATLIVMLALAMGFMVAGLMASAFHLGHPERAWRALTQWRSSWLSREAISAILALIPLAVAFGMAVLGLKILPWILIIAGILSVMTLYTTAMIYASLKTIPAWNNNWVIWGFQTYALASGGVIYIAFPGPQQSWALAVAALLLIALMIKIATWNAVDKGRGRFKREEALALSDLGVAHPFDAPHTQENYLQREMGYNLDPLLRMRLRWMALGLGFIAPAVLVFLADVLPYWSVSTGLAAVLSLIGIGFERWLFFAEAQHVVRLFYDRSEV